MTPHHRLPPNPTKITRIVNCPHGGMNDLCVEVIGWEIAPVLLLHVSRPSGVEIASGLPGQTPVSPFHVTLGRLQAPAPSPHKRQAMPAPPSTLGLEPEVWLVRADGKVSCYQKLVEASQQAMREHAMACETCLGQRFLDPERVFHATLTNAGGGRPDASVSRVWAFKRELIGPGA